MDLEKLKQIARDISKNAYAKYSNFPVGAAFSDEHGKIYSGVNVENSSYGLTLCAERNAIAHAVSQGPCTIETLVVYTPTQIPTPPCGACRQVIAEFSKTAKIVLICDSDETVTTTIGELLPGAFAIDDYR